MGCQRSKGKSAMRGRAADTAEMRVDFPALGKPTRPTSASKRSSSMSVRSSPGIPGCAKRGARFVEVAKKALPFPPFPPFAAITSAFGVFRSASSSPDSSAFTDKRSLGNTHNEIWSVFSMLIFSSPMLSSFSTEMFYARSRSTSVFNCGSTRKMTLPPLPPFPQPGRLVDDTFRAERRRSRVHHHQLLRGVELHQQSA